MKQESTQNKESVAKELEEVLLIAFDPDIPTKLSGHHLEHLRLSAISDEVISRTAICSVSPNVLHQHMGIAFFYTTLDGKILHYRLRLDEPIVKDNGTQKYFQPSGSHLPCYFQHTGVQEILDGTIPLFIVEGEKKLLSLASLVNCSEHAIIAIPGCWNYLASKDQRDNREKKLADIYYKIPFDNRNVFFIPDSDFFYNQNVYLAYTTFINLLIKLGAKVSLVDLRLEKDTFENKIGVDDFLVHNGFQALQNRIDHPFWQFFCINDNILVNLQNKTIDVAKVLQAAILIESKVPLL